MHGDLCFGNLNRGVATYGLSYLNLNRALSNTWWNNACRLSELNTKKAQRRAFLAAAKINDRIPRASTFGKPVIIQKRNPT
nr:MAG TPA: hypothetical protein [Caudoviricetes sp.]